MLWLLGLFTFAVQCSSQPEHSYLSAVFCVVFFTHPNAVSAWRTFVDDFKHYCTVNRISGTPDKYIQGFFVPTDAALVDGKWNGLRKRVNGELGPLIPVPVRRSLVWVNEGATDDLDVKTLFALAKEFVPDISKTVQAVITRVPGSFEAGGGEKYLKTESSLTSKWESDTAKMQRMLQRYPNLKLPLPIRVIGDALRTTIVVQKIQQYQNVIQLLQTNADTFGYDIDFKNIYADRYRSGYVGVHAKLRFNRDQKHLLAEIQIHFQDINDNTQDCPKEYTHTPYEIARSFEFANLFLTQPANETAKQIIDNANLAVKVVFAFGLQWVAANNSLPAPSPDSKGGIRSMVNEITSGPAAVSRFYIARGFLFKAAYDEDYGISSLQMYDPSLGKYTKSYFPDRDVQFYDWLGWIEDEEDAGLTIDAKDEPVYAQALKAQAATKSKTTAETDEAAAVAPKVGSWAQFLTYGMPALGGVIVGGALVYMAMQCKRLCCRRNANGVELYHRLPA